MRQKRILLIVTAIFILLLILLVKNQLKTLNELPFSVRVVMNGETETVNLWESEDGIYYVFLPSYAVSANLYIHMNTEVPVYCDDQLLYNGMPCDMFSEGKSNNLRFSRMGKSVTKQVIFLYSKNIATMYIDTQSGSMDYIHEKKGNKEAGAMRLYISDGTLNYSGQLVSIGGRGNSTWSLSGKKPYSILLSTEANLLGMGAADRWILLANADDDSHMRNKIVFDFAAKMGLAYSPNSQWIEVYLNNTYNGLYLLCERNEVHPQRLDIENQDSFLVSLEHEGRMKQQNYPYISTESGKYLRIHNFQSFSENMLVELTAIWQSVENAIQSSDSVDPITGKHLNEIIDYDAWVAKYLIEELFGNIDAGNLSQYFYFDGNKENGKIAAGPVWDYDHALGNRAEWQLTAPNTFFSNRKIIEEGYSSPWFYYLAEKESFIGDVARQYQEKCLTLLDELLEEKLFIYAEQIETAAQNDLLRWNMGKTAMISEVEYIRNFLKERINFLNKIWIENEEYFVVRARRGSYGYYCYYIVFPGECLERLPEFEDTENVTYTGWYYKDSEEPFDINRPITQNTEIYAKAEYRTPEKIEQILKIIPLGIIGILGIILMMLDFRRMGKKR